MYKNKLLTKALVGVAVAMPLTASMLHVSAENNETETPATNLVEEVAGHGSIQIRVVDSAHKGIEGATVELLNSKGQGMQVVTDEFGNANFTDVPAGEVYTAALALVPEGYEYNEYRTAEITVENAGHYEDFIAVNATQVGETSEEDYVGHGSVQIRVVDNGFNPVEGATVELLNSKGQGMQVVTDEFGNANFTDVPAGEVYTAALALVPEGYEYNAYRTAEITVENTGHYEDFITVDRVQSEKPEESKEESDSKGMISDTISIGDVQNETSEETSKTEESKVEESKVVTKKEDKKELPDTGEAVGMTALIAGLLGIAGLGTLFLNRRKNK